MSGAREALETVRQLVFAMDYEPRMSDAPEIGEAYRRGWAAARARACELLASASASYFYADHQWVQATAADAETGTRTLLPFMVCTQCRRRSDMVPTTIGCEPLTPAQAAQWAEVDAAFVAAQQALAGRRADGR